MKLVFTSLHLKVPKLTVVVQDDDGKQRRVELTWMATGEESRLPPPQWLESIKGEVEHQRNEELRPSQVAPWMR
jgi:hypothetical protein